VLLFEIHQLPTDSSEEAEFLQAARATAEGVPVVLVAASVLLVLADRLCRVELFLGLPGS
jgi:hypothetical protein